MKKLALTITLACSLIVTITLMNSGCSKDRIQQPTLNSYDSPNSYLDSKQQQEQEFLITSDTGTTPITGNQGTQISGSRACLMKPNGDSVGLPFVVKLVELYTPKDMIYYRMPTVASDTILETDGEIRLRAFKDGTELLLRPGCSFPVKMPNASPKNYMRAFYGFSVGAYTDWTDDPASLGVSTSFVPVFATTSGAYLTNDVRLGWLNCDFKRGSASNHHLTFTSTTDILTNVAFFVYFPTTKTVMQVYNLTSGSIPDGSAVKIIGLAVNGSGTLYSFTQNLTVTSNTSVDVTMSATTDAAFTAMLDAL